MIKEDKRFYNRETNEYEIAWCPSCGFLEIDDMGNIRHPHLDHVLASRLQNGFKTIYTSMESS